MLRKIKGLPRRPMEQALSFCDSSGGSSVRHTQLLYLASQRWKPKPLPDKDADIAHPVVHRFCVTSVESISISHEPSRFLGSNCACYRSSPMLEMILLALSPPLPPSYRLLVSCIGASLGWLFVSRKELGAVLPLLMLSALCAFFIGVVLQRWDWFGQLTFVIALSGGVLSARLLRRSRP